MNRDNIQRNAKSNNIGIKENQKEDSHKSPLRIVHVLGRLDRGGAETMVMNLYRRMDKSRIQFDFVLHTQEECAYSEEVRCLGGRIFSVPAFKAGTAAGYRKAWKELLAAHPEWKIIHSHVRSTASLYLPLARKAGMKTIIHSHNTASGSGASALVKTLLQYPLRYQADFLFACSKEAGNWLYGEKACRSSRFYLLKNAIATERFAFREEMREKKRKELGISEQAFVVGHVGRFEEQKNHKFLLEIYEAMQSRVSAGGAMKTHGKDDESGECASRECILLLIGEGKLEEAVRRQAEQKNLKNVRFLGNRADVNELLSAMDVFLFPSLFEGLPVTLIEAQAAGLPVAASDTITKEVGVTPLIRMLSLHERADRWAEQIISVMQCTEEYAETECAETECDGKTEKKQETSKNGGECQTTRRQASEEAVKRICKAGYDTEQTAEWLTGFYESI